MIITNAEVYGEREMSDDKKLTKRQIHANQTREKLLEAGKVIFLKEGFQKTTMTKINKLAHTGYGTGYAHFKNKDALFVELMESIMEKMFTLADLPFFPTNKNEARDLIKHQVYLFKELSLKEQEIMLVIKEAIGISETVKQKWDEIQTRFIDGIARDIKNLKKHDLFKTQLSISLISRAWYYLNEQIMWDLILGNIDKDLDNITDDLTEFYMNGIYR